MRISDLVNLFEANEDISLDYIRKNCSQAIERYKQGDIIYRGSNNHGDYFLRTENKVRRQAANASANLHTNIINRSKEFSGFPKREFICTTGINKARQYGNMVYIALPCNNSNIGVCPKDDVFYSFKGIRDYQFASIGQFYNIMITIMGDYDIDVYINTIADIKRVFKELNRQWLEFVQDVDFIDGITTERDFFESIEYTSMDRDFKKNILIPAIKSGKVDGIINLFSSDGWYYDNIDKVVLPRNREVWTDSKIVFIKQSVLEADILGIEKPKDDAEYTIDKNRGKDKFWIVKKVGSDQQMIGDIHDSKYAVLKYAKEHNINLSDWDI